MYLDRYLRLIAGVFVLASVALGYFAHPAWFLLTAIVGVSLLSGGVLGWCPMMAVLRALGVRRVPDGCTCD